MNPTRRLLRIALIAIAGVGVIGVGAGAVLIARFDPNAYKPDIVQAVKHATGRDLTLNGKISLKPSLWPTIQVENVALANPPGFSRPVLATVQGLELQLGLLPLLASRIEIDRLVLIHPDILLETDTAGHPNWQMKPEAAPTSAQPGSPVAVKSDHAPTNVSVDTIHIIGGTIGYRDGKTGKITTVTLPKLEASAASPDSLFHVNADAIYSGTTLNLIADTGSINRLQDRAATSPWPVKLTLTAAGASLSADGSMTQPLQGKGYQLSVNAKIPDLSALAPLLPAIALPPLHEVSFAANIADTGGMLPIFSTLTLHVGASDLRTRIPGLMLDKLDIDAPRADQPIKANASGKLGDTPVNLAGTLGAPALLLPDAKPAPFPVDVTMQAAGATVSAKGSIANARAQSGMSVALAAEIPDLSALSPLVRRPLPALKTVAFHGTLTDADGGLLHGAALRGFSLTSQQGDLAGDITIGLGARIALTGVLKSNHIDLDALQAAVDKSPAATPPAAAPKPSTPPPPAKAHSDRLFSDQTLPFDSLRAADADMKLDIADLHTDGADYKAIATHVVLTNGKLAVDPFAADLPGGHLTASLSVDATRPGPPIHIVAHAPGLALKTILAALHQQPYASGNLEVYANLSGAGDSPHAIAASLDGSLGLAMAGGTIDNQLLIGSTFGKVMEAVNVLNLAAKGGTDAVKCFGMRMDATHGVGAIKALALSSSLLTMTGLGTVNSGTETLDLALRLQTRVAGTGLVIPVSVSGPIRNPGVKVNDLGTAGANAGAIAGAVIGNATPLGIVGGLLGADKLFSTGTTDICPPALALARGQPVPASASAPAPAAKPPASDPGAILKNLFR